MSGIMTNGRKRAILKAHRATQEECTYQVEEKEASWCSRKLGAPIYCQSIGESFGVDGWIGETCSK